MTARVVVIHRYFWPDSAPYASILRSIADRWAEGGDDVHVLTAKSSYSSATQARPASEMLGRLTVQRLPVVDERRVRVGRLVNFVLFPMLCALRVMFGPRPDLVMCSTAPQVVLGRLVSWAARVRKAAFIYHCMDLQPEIGRLSGDFANPAIYRLLARLDRATMRDAAAIVVLSEDMRKSVLRRDPALDRSIVVLNNFALPDYENPSVPAELVVPPPADGTLRLVFTGNLGRFQRLEEVICGLAPVSRPVELVFMGEGRAEPAIRAAVADLPGDSMLTVRMVPQGSLRQAKALMRSAHVGLVSLMPGVVRFAYPSKTVTYLTEGLPVLTYCETDSELASMTTAKRVGWAADNPKQLCAAVEAAGQAMLDNPNPQAAERRRERTRVIADSQFGAQAALRHWQQLHDDLLHGSSPSTSRPASAANLRRSRTDG